jgi:putative transposase
VADSVSVSATVDTVTELFRRSVRKHPARPAVGDGSRRLTYARPAAQGLSVLGRDGLLQQLTKRFLEATLDAEMDEHLGYGKHDPVGRNGGNSRNGKRSKTLLTEVGPMPIDVPRDRDSSFTPTIVAKRQRRLGGIDDLVISLTARGLTTGEAAAHLTEVYGATVSKDHISNITDRVLNGMAEWQNRPLDSVYPVIFIDCIHVKIRDGQVANRPVYVALATTADGGKDIFGLWAGDGGEGAKYWLRVLTELKNRGVADVCIMVCDGLNGLPDAIGEVWPQTVVQTCLIHLLRNSFKYASKADWGQISKDLKTVYTAVSEQAAFAAFAEFGSKWERKYPAIVRLWTNAWAEFVPFLAFDTEIRKIVCSTNAIESLNARFRRAVNARGRTLRRPCGQRRQFARFNPRRFDSSAFAIITSSAGGRSRSSAPSGPVPIGQRPAPGARQRSVVNPQRTPQSTELPSAPVPASATGRPAPVAGHRRKVAFYPSRTATLGPRPRR